MIVEPKPPGAFRKARAFSVAKRAGQHNEDSWQNSRKGAGGVSDGASISFDSAAWSRILVRRYAQNPIFDRSWLDSAIAAYNELHDRDALPWMQQAAYDRGSFASLLGVRLCDPLRVAVLAIGDSIALLCDRDRIVASFPYEAPEQFEADPQLLSTNTAENKFLERLDIAKDLSLEWDLGALERPALLCATDALGCWVLTQRGREPSPIAMLRRIKTRRDFARLVASERAAGRLRRDDATFLAYWDWSE